MFLCVLKNHSISERGIVQSQPIETKILFMYQFQNFKTEVLPVIQNSKLKTQTPTQTSTARMIILQEETQSFLKSFAVCSQNLKCLNVYDIWTCNPTSRNLS